jgi:hypothetical protein
VEEADEQMIGQINTSFENTPYSILGNVGVGTFEVNEFRPSSMQNPDEQIHI